MTRHEHPEVRELEDAAWSLKDLVADFYPRSLSGADKAVLSSVLRDVERLHARLLQLRDKRKRTATTEPEQQATDTRQTTIEGTEPPA